MPYDCADALVFSVQHYSGHEHVNVGSGEEDIDSATWRKMIVASSGLDGAIELGPVQARRQRPRKLMIQPSSGRWAGQPDDRNPESG